MNVSTSYRNVCNRAATTLIAVVFTAGLWAQQNADDQTTAIDEAVRRIETIATQTCESLKYVAPTIELWLHSPKYFQETASNNDSYDKNNRELSENPIHEADLKRRNALIEKYGQEIGMEIYNRRLCLGMTTEMVYESIGEPCDVFVQNDSLVAQMHWAYWLYDIYLSFEDNILVRFREL